jgi:hypothetical protein
MPPPSGGGRMTGASSAWSPTNATANSFCKTIRIPSFLARLQVALDGFGLLVGYCCASSGAQGL